MPSGAIRTGGGERGAGHAGQPGSPGAQAASQQPPATTSIREFVPMTQDIPCDFCGGGDFVFFSDKMRHDLNLKTVLCKRCGLAQTNPQPTAESLATFYGRFYHLFHQRVGVDEAYLARSKRMAERRFQVIARFLDPAARAAVLEVGPGAGGFLAKCQESSVWESLGVEPGTESYEWCASRGLKVVHEGIEEFESRDRFSLIVAFNVMDHLRSPRAFLEKCHALLADDGLLLLEVGNFERPGLPREQFLQFPLLYQLTPISLTNYLERAGFRPIYVDEAVRSEGTGTLTMVARRSSERRTGDFIRIDLEKHLSGMERKDRIYRLADRLPRFSIFERLRAVLKSVH
ncbi:MAG TPA: methyltransferase domain-containing protein [Pirellulales bacterium]|jgi:SAM-dependent methyltransferase|nr:methyltransferase domain-containing protein [Pirellulales bacterium]